jgi:hypothetical protein
MSMKLDSGQKHVLRLIAKGQQCADGWAPVSAAVYPVVKSTMPAELVEHEPVGAEGRGRARLTAEGEAVLNAMEWLQ